MTEENLRNLLTNRTGPTSYGYCQCGCGGKTNLVKENDSYRGILKGEPRRFIEGHQTHRKTKYIVNPETGCWEWQLYRDKKGYARTTIKGKSPLVHRTLFELVKGPIPKGLFLDHLCKNKGCINPDHLEIVTTAENNRRGPLARLTPSDVLNIRELWASNRYNFSELGRVYGVSDVHIARIVNRSVWKDI